MASHDKCLICAHEDLGLLSGYERHNLVKCSGCGFVFISKIPTRSELDDHYKVYAYSEGQYMSEVTRNRYLELIEEFNTFKSTGKILDVGCGAGNFLTIAQEKGWQSFGTEFSETAVQHCVSKGLNVSNGILDIQEYEANSFDVITSFEVIEHINNPTEELSRFFHLLRPGGLLYCTTPNFNAISRFYLGADYNIIQYPEHLSYYTTSTLDKVLSDAGFKKRNIKTSGISINRLQAAKAKSSEQTTDINTDESLRSSIDKNVFLKFLKWVVNAGLNMTRTGGTLKAYYIKNI